MERICISDLMKLSQVNGEFGSGCSFMFSIESFNALKSGKLKIIFSTYANACNNDFVFECNMISGVVRILVGGKQNKVSFANGCRGNFDLRLWRSSNVFIGEGSSSNGTKIILDNSSLVCGKDCMFSEGITIQTSDQHAIVDLKTKNIVNNISKKVELGNHVWIGRNVTICPNVVIGHGSIIGISSVVTGIIPSMSLAVGNTAKVIKSDITWSRPVDRLDEFSMLYIDEYQG